MKVRLVRIANTTIADSDPIRSSHLRKNSSPSRKPRWSVVLKDFSGVLQSHFQHPISRIVHGHTTVLSRHHSKRLVSSLSSSPRSSLLPIMLANNLSKRIGQISANTNSMLKKLVDRLGGNR